MHWRGSMKARLSRFLLPSLLVLGPAGGCASGGGGGGYDTTTDGVDDGTGTDVPVDVPVEGEPDIVGDAPPDGSIALPFHMETSGGALMTSPAHRLELFIGPVGPVGSHTSETYALDLGPAGIRNH
jgi:hypothetical protein